MINSSNDLQDIKIDDLPPHEQPDKNWANFIFDIYTDAQCDPRQ